MSGEAPGSETPAAEEGAQGTKGRPGPHRRLYDWVLHWAETPWGPTALFGLSMAESSFFPIPPDPLLMALCLGRIARAFRFAAIATGASVIGGVIGYGIGALAWPLVEGWFYAYIPGVGPDAFAQVQALYDRFDFWAIFFAGLTPIPYKVFTLSAGVFSINFGIFLVASVLSRGLRFFLVAGLIYRFGPQMAAFIDRYFNALTIAFGVLLVAGFVLIEFLL